MLFNRKPEDALENAKDIMDSTKDLWNGGNVLAGGIGKDQTVFKKPYGFIIIGIVFFSACGVLLSAYLQTVFEKVFGWMGKSVVYSFRAIIGLLVLVFSAPIVIVLLFIDPITGENTKLGNKVTKYEKNSDKA